MEKKRMVTGIKPTGSSITLGNYLGVIKPLIKYKDDYDLWIFIADLHALTLHIDPKQLKENTKNLLALYFACGLIPEDCTIFKQSQISGHTELSWVLTCNTPLSDFTKMPQYKNYININKNKAVPTGILMYPSLMSADILLYDTDIVPAGIDQMPHVDLARDQAEAFNKLYNTEIFKLPEGLLDKTTSKIMSLSNPEKKMSKSESESGTIYILDDIELSKKKIMRALTDSENKVYFNKETKPGISNLMIIYSALSGETLNQIEDKYKDITNYGIFKKDLCKLLEEELLPIQEKVNEYLNTPSFEQYCKEALAYSTLKARSVASDKLKEIYNVVGL